MRKPAEMKKPAKNQKKQSEHVYFEEEDTIDNGKIKKKSSKKGMNKSKAKRIVKAIEDGVVDAIQKVLKNSSIKFTQIPVIKIV